MAKKQPRKKTTPAKRAKTKLHEQAQGRFDALLELWQGAAENPNATNLRKLAQESGALERIFREIRTHAETVARSAQASQLALKTIRANAPGPAREAALAPAASQKVVEESFFTAAEVSPSAEPDMNLESLFGQVSDSVVKAQQRLDMASIAYAQETKESPIPPAFYSIPNVKAEVKLGFTVKDGSNIFVKLFGKPEDVSSYAESTVSFEVVASPPPPGGPGTYCVPIPHIFVVGPERERVAAAVVGIRNAIRASTGIEVPTNPSQWLPEAIVLRAGAEEVPPAKRAAYTMILRGAQVTDPCLVVRLTLDQPESAISVAARDGNLELALFDLVATLRDWESAVTRPLQPRWQTPGRELPTG